MNTQNLFAALRPFATLRATLLSITLLFPTILLCQTTEGDIENLLERILNEEEIDAGLLDLIERYRTTPLQLYSTTAEELSELPGISPQTALCILEFLRTNHPVSFDEFSSLNWLTDELLQLLRALTRLDSSPPSRELHLQFRGRITRDVQKRKGFSENQYRVLERAPSSGSTPILDTIAIGSRYVGSPEGILTRILFDYGEYSGGITFEKDVGEPLLFSDTTNFTYENYERIEEGINQTNKGTKTRLGSFLSFHAQAKFSPATLLIGDYTAAFGQGLVFGENFSGRKGTSATGDPYNGGRGLRSYRSAGERYFFRGAGIYLNRGEWLPHWLAITAFVSERSLDGSIVEELRANEDSIATISAIRNDGLHRTRTDIRHAATFSERVIGGHIDGWIAGGNVGLTIGRGEYSLPIISSNISTPQRDDWTLASLDVDFPFTSGRIFGELSLDQGGSVSLVSGTALRFPGADLTLSVRSYQPNYFSPYGVAFGESPANPRNERGLYLGVRTRLFPRTFLSFYGDLYQIPEGNRTNPFPITGTEGGIFLDYGITRDLSLEVSVRGEGREELESTEDISGREVEKLIDRIVANGRVTARWKPREGSVELRARVEGKVARFSELQPNQGGVLTFLDLRWHPLPTLSLGSRLILFDADGSDVRLYEFEQDFPGRLSNMSLSGEGRRFYILAKWEPLTHLGFAIRYDETWYVDREVISPGSLQEIQGSTTGKWSFQVDGSW